MNLAKGYHGDEPTENYRLTHRHIYLIISVFSTHQSLIQQTLNQHERKSYQTPGKLKTRYVSQDLVEDKKESEYWVQ